MSTESTHAPETPALHPGFCAICGGDLDNLDVEPCCYHAPDCELWAPLPDALVMRFCTCADLYVCPSCCDHCRKGASLLESDRFDERMVWVLRACLWGVAGLLAVAVVAEAVRWIGDVIR